MRRVFALLCALLTLTWAQSATADDMTLLGVGQGGKAVTTTYVGPGDQTSFTAWYSVARAYSAAYAISQGLAFNAENGSQTVNCDFPVTTAGAIGLSENCSVGISNGQTMAVFCGVGCTVAKMYDQTGGGRDISQATIANQPTLTISCVNSLPCAVYSSASVSLASSGNFTPATGLVSVAAVANRASGSGAGVFLSSNNNTAGNRIRAVLSTANQWSIGTATQLAATAADATFHSATGVMNTSSSVIAIDGTETSGASTSGVAAGLTNQSGSASTTIDISEAGFTDNVAYSGTVRTNLCHNMRLAYATSGSC